MNKTLRNTGFTAIVLLLTFVGIRWNKQAVPNRQPIVAESTTLAAPLPFTQRSSAKNDVIGQYVHPLVP